MNDNQYNLDFQKSIRPASLLFVGSNDMKELFDPNRGDYFGSFSEALFIEADPDVAARLEMNLKKYNSEFNKKFKGLGYLISDTDGSEYSFNILSNGGQSSSIYPPDWEGIERLFPGLKLKSMGTKQLVSKTLSTVLEEEKWSARVFDMEIDLQGAELKALRGLDDKYFDRIITLTVEVSTDNHYRGAPLFPEIDNFLTHRGFFLCPPWGPGFHDDGSGHWGDPKFYSCLKTAVPLEEYFDLLPPIRERDYSAWHLPPHGPVTYLNKNFNKMLDR
jgi:FkbM family methyltransferase